MKYFGIFTFGIITGILGVLWQSYLFSTAINWFLLDLGLVLLSKKTVAAGLLFIRYAAYQHSYVESDKDLAEKLGESCGITFILPVFMFLTAAAIHRFM